MRRTTAILPVQRPLPVPRGWILVGGALAGWALFAGLWVGVSQLFGFVLTVI